MNNFPTPQELKLIAESINNKKFQHDKELITAMLIDAANEGKNKIEVRQDKLEALNVTQRILNAEGYKTKLFNGCQLDPSTPTLIIEF